MDPTREKEWDARLWQHPANSGPYHARRQPRPQIADDGQAGVCYDPLEGTLKALSDHGKPGRAIALDEAARRLCVSVTQLQRWLTHNNNIFRCEYEGTD